VIIIANVTANDRTTQAAPIVTSWIATSARAVSGAASSRPTRSSSSSPRRSRVLRLTAQIATREAITQPPSHAVNPPAVSMPRGRPCNMRTTGARSNIASEVRDSASGYVARKLRTSRTT
jgi:hypothetical protein